VHARLEGVCIALAVSLRVVAHSAHLIEKLPLLFIPCNGTQERVQRDDPKVAMHDGSTFYPLQLRKRAVKDEHGIVGKLVSSIAVFLGDVGGGEFKPLLGLCISKG
jgi:hypothetical protein